MLTFDTSLQSWKNKLCSKTKCTVNVVLDFPHRYFQSCDSIPPSPFPPKIITEQFFTFQATRFCGAGCCWLPAAGAPPPSQLRTEAEAKREREGERTDGGRIVHLWGRETMTNRSKTETTTAESKGQRCHLHWRYYDTMNFALFSNKSPFKFGVYTQQIL